MAKRDPEFEYFANGDKAYGYIIFMHETFDLGRYSAVPALKDDVKATLTMMRKALLYLRVDMICGASTVSKREIKALYDKWGAYNPQIRHRVHLFQSAADFKTVTSLSADDIKAAPCGGFRILPIVLLPKNKL